MIAFRINCVNKFKYRIFTTYSKNFENVQDKDKLLIFMKLFGLHRRTAARNILDKHPHLYEIESEDIIKTNDLLMSINTSTDEIRKRPTILMNNAITLKNRINVLLECGFNKIDINLLDKYIVIMNRPIKSLKTLGLLTKDMVVSEEINRLLNIPLGNDFEDDKSLKQIRQQLFNMFLMNKLNMSDDECKKTWNSYAALRHKSFKSIIEMLYILTQDLNFTNDRIQRNMYVLHADPENVRKLLNEMKTLGKMQMKDVLFARPKLMMTCMESLQKSEQFIRDFGIPDSSMESCLEVFTLGYKTIYQRLLEMKKIKEFNVLVTHPRVLRLIHYQTKARVRLEYLKLLKVKCASLHVLSSNSQAFERYARDGTDRTRGCDVVLMLSQIFIKPEDEIRRQLIRHPNWCHVPAYSVKQTLDDLKYTAKYNSDAIYSCLYILLYSFERITEQLVMLKNKENLYFCELTQSQQLRLCLYMIELDFHFTGDGIWPETINISCDNYSTIQPKMPSSLYNQYKYGRSDTKMNAE